MRSYEQYMSWFVVSVISLQIDYKRVKSELSVTSVAAFHKTK